ncbi:MAG: FlgD immunoglobulin-like domain containing protein [Candidatus Limnocylindrales bacterium]|nr:FlgD immunoglobulin-like domain containing protein [Candidatus Limnocylindrales bacterium]
MRKTAVALVLLLLASLGAAVPSVAASGEPKVVIIVGATHGMTSTYRAYADQAYAEAIRHTSNVVKVYSPNATWARVKAAVSGASVVIYMGHGNGWPSPYTYDPSYTTKDGFGLNATEGAGDSNNVYYGEPYVSTLDLAPGAVVLLHHLCYAAGNSEPGQAEPTVSVARQRVDNYAAGFLKAGAAAVIADGHAGPEGYLRTLFTTQGPIESLWATQPYTNGNIVSFPSVRTPGATAYQDPRTPTSGFYRSLVVRSSGVTVGDLVNSGAGDTGVDPPSLAVPGNASVATEGANLFSDPATGIPSRTLTAGTRLRVMDQLSAFGLTAQRVVLVQGLDDPSISGYMSVDDLVARDSAAPALRSLDLGGGAFSPNGDGVADQVVLGGTFTEAVNWTAAIQGPSGYELFQGNGSGTSFQLVWNPAGTGQYVPDGTYMLSISAVDAWQNRPLNASGTIAVDTTPAQLTTLTPGPATALSFSPNGDGYRETVALSATSSEPGSVVATVRDGYGSTVKSWTVAAGLGPISVVWDGRDSGGSIAPDGRYIVSVAPRDAGGNTGPSQERTVSLVGALRSVASSTSVFFPQDLDQLAPTTELSFSLSRPMTVTWTLRDAAAKVIDTHLAAAPLDAGRYTWSFDGRRSDGSMLPPGRYLSYVVARDGTLVAAQSIAFEADAFLIKPSDATPGRGQTITVTVTTAEPLSANPRVTVSQPGVTAWSVGTVKLSSTTYRATIKLKTGGTGTVTFKATGKDVGGAAQSTRRAFPLH